MISGTVTMTVVWWQQQASALQQQGRRCPLLLNETNSRRVLPTAAATATHGCKPTSRAGEVPLTLWTYLDQSGSGPLRVSSIICCRQVIC